MEPPRSQSHKTNGWGARGIERLGPSLRASLDDLVAKVSGNAERRVPWRHAFGELRKESRVYPGFFPELSGRELLAPNSRAGEIDPSYSYSNLRVRPPHQGTAVTGRSACRSTGL